MPPLLDQQLNVHGPGVDPTPVARLPVQPGNSDLCFVYDGPIDDAIVHLGAHDVRIELGPVDRPGARGTGLSVYFRDPDGSLLELISYGAAAGRREPPSPPVNRASSRIGEGLKPLTIR